jgi:hypothetical protein
MRATPKKASQPGLFGIFLVRTFELKGLKICNFHAGGAWPLPQRRTWRGGDDHAGLERNRV